MSNQLSSLLQEQLEKYNLSLDNWRELVQRLLDYGVLCHELVNDYLGLMGVRFQHDSHFRFVRILPPGARLPGMDDESDEPFNAGLRSRLNQHEVALVLVLRAEYDKALREGSIDEQGCATLSLEAIAMAMKSLLRRSLPENLGERRQAFKRLRQLRLINFFAESDIDSTESWIKIRPLIINLVNNEWLEQIRNHLAENLLLVEEDPDGQDQDDSAEPRSRKSAPHLNRSLFAAEE
jgi:hypothetical protein